MNSATRKRIGDALEHRTATALRARCWSVNEWGQGALTVAVRAALRSTDSSLRWTPDLIAARGDTVTLIDCKARMTSNDTNRHSIERAALRAHLQLVAWTNLPLYYIFDDLTVLTPHDAMTAKHPGPHSRLGSGAPYYFIESGRTQQFDDVFGASSALQSASCTCPSAVRTAAI